MARNAVEGALLSALGELGKVLGETRVMNAAGQVLQTVGQTKAAVDGSVAAALGLAGLPSKADVDKLRRQLDVVQATLGNLSRKLDRLLEESAHHTAPVAATSRTRRPKRGPAADPAAS